MKETITHVAMVLQNGTQYNLPAPKRHHHIFGVMHNDGVLPEDRYGCTQGFLTSTGRFVDRTEAGKIAIEAGQIKTLKWHPYLYSEDLW